MKKKMHIESAGVSDVGRQRQLNEDAFTSGDELELYAIADGMGGHMQGEVASQTAIAKLSKELNSHFKHGADTEKQEVCYNVIVDTIAECNNLILEKNQQNGSRLGEGMGTTLVGVYFLNNSTQAITFNVGDSRIYRYRDRDLVQITRDQTMYQEWVEGGELGLPPAQNILVNAVGLVEELQADIRLENVNDGDMYLICSDGLSGLVDNEVLDDILSKTNELSVTSICKQLVDLANKNGGTDNITVILARVKLQPSEESTPVVDTQKTVKRIDNV
ncbi:MAG: PP2C family serine/threonine-protein phosphatase [Granulosicoccus sp.]